MLDEYGYGQREHCRYFKLNLTRLCELWRKFRNRKGNNWQAECEMAERSKAEFEAWFSKPAGRKRDDS